MRYQIVCTTKRIDDSIDKLGFIPEGGDKNQASNLSEKEEVNLLIRQGNTFFFTNFLVPVPKCLETLDIISNAHIGFSISSFNFSVSHLSEEQDQLFFIDFGNVLQTVNLVELFCEKNHFFSQSIDSDITASPLRTFYRNVYSMFHIDDISQNYI